MTDKHAFGSVWTQIKLEILEQYLNAFNSALSKKGFTRIYIDAFAGTGRCDINVDGQRTSIIGSARRALMTNPAFHKHYFIEVDAQKRIALQTLENEYPNKGIKIISKDANVVLNDLCSQEHWQSTRAVLFLDPFGMEVQWSTLEAVTKTHAIDVWYLFPYAGVFRQMPRNADRLDNSKAMALTRVFGTDEWREIFYKPKRQIGLFENSDSDERTASHSEILNFVSKRLKLLFPAVSTPKVLYQKGNLKNPKGPPLFALYFAVSNPSPSAYRLALRIAGHILKTP